MLPDVGEDARPKHSIGHCVGQHVAVGGGADPNRVRDADTTNDQWRLTVERVCVESPSDSGAGQRHLFLVRFDLGQGAVQSLDGLLLVDLEAEGQLGTEG